MSNADEHYRELFDSRYVAALIAAMACFGLFQSASARTNADVAWYLYAASRILDGAQLGQDIVEVNTPTIVAISVGIEALARLIGCAASQLLPWLVTAVSCASLAVCAQIARDWSATVRQPFLIALAYLLLIHVGGMFGQREHLLLIFIAPYLCSVVELAEMRRTPAKLAVLIGAMAAIGFALKPFFVLAWIGLEAYAVYRRGTAALRRPESLAILGTFLLIALGVALWTPEYVPFAIESWPLYRAYQPYGDLPLVLSGSFAFVLLAIVVAQQAGLPLVPLADVLAILSGMLSLGVILQGKGWHYQWFPAVAVGTILLVLAAAAMAARARKLTRAALQAATALTVLVLALRTYQFWAADQPERHELDALVRRHARGGSILALSSHLYAGFPLVNETGVGWTSRYPTMWQLPAFCGEPSSKPADISLAEKQFLDAVYADFSSARPALLLVDAIPPLPKLTDFDYLEYFEKDPRLAGVLEEYRFLRQVGRYRILLRDKLR